METAKESARPHARAALRVVFIAGTGRSGTTLLGNALGTFPGAVSVGEVKYGFAHGLARDGFCGCRAAIRDCPVWAPALEAAFGAIPTHDTALAFDARLSAVTRTRRVPWWLTGGDSVEVRDLADVLGRLLVALADAAGAHTVVDSSKLPAYGALLARSPHLDVHVVHAVRDPRAVAWSWQRSTASQAVAGFDQELERFSPGKSSLMWLESTGSTHALARRAGRTVHVVRYEDLVDDPASVLTRVGRAVGLLDAGDAAAFVGPDGLDLATSHAIHGNPNRVRSGPLVLRRDDEWAAAMPAGQTRLVSTLTAPGRWWHGY